MTDFLGGFWSRLMACGDGLYVMFFSISILACRENIFCSFVHFFLFDIDRSLISYGHGSWTK